MTGTLPDKPRGSDGFGWDDIFVPDGQKLEDDQKPKTFAEMTPEEKEAHSMRTRALQAIKDEPFTIGCYTFMLQEPTDNEVNRVRWQELEENEAAMAFANQLERGDSGVVVREDSSDFYDRYTVYPESPSVALVVSDIEMARVQREANGNPIILQMGPKAERLAVAQRAELFAVTHTPNVIEHIHDINEGRVTTVHRSNQRSSVVDRALGINPETPTEELLRGRGVGGAVSFEQIGYMKVSSPKNISRTEVRESGLYHKVGRRGRLPMGLGAMPPVSGQLDMVTTAALNHMMVTIPRNSLLVDVDKRMRLAEAAMTRIEAMPISEYEKEIARANIGLAVGTNNPEEEVAVAKRFQDEFGINLFRVYTINSDPRVVQTSRGLREELGDEAELFIGQLPFDLAQSIVNEKDIRPDAILFGHGGGRQCTSATTGMVISTVEELYLASLNPAFNNVSLGVEGGVGKNFGTALMMGADFVLYSNQLAHGTREASQGLYLVDKKGKPVQPYPGSASPVTQLIEASHPGVNRVGPAGRTHNPEGKPGFMEHEKKANSAAVLMGEMLGKAGRTLADRGWHSIQEMRVWQQANAQSEKPIELFRLPSSDARAVGEAYRDAR